MHWIQPLTEISLADIDRVGGKAAHLGALVRAGFPVPAGFVIDTNAFIAHFGEVTDPLVRPRPPLLQTELMTEVMQALLDHLGEDEQFAVRSSSTDEDSSLASFAGQHSTYYFVPPNRIDQAIIDCWMSLWSSAAIAYRRAGWHEITSGEPVRMAVIVQRMLPATRSGIAFSRDPVNTSSTDTLIEASWGLGAAIADGRVSPDHARVSEDGESVSYAVSDKQFQVSPKPDNHNEQRLQEVPKSKRYSAVLTENEARHIAQISLQLETLFDAPQDVEWAFVDDELFLLQSRPVTTRAEYPDIEERLVLFKPLAENFTEPLTPLSEDLYASVLPRIGAFLDGRLYLRLDPIARLIMLRISEAELVDLVLLRRVPLEIKLSWSKSLAAVALMACAFLVDGANWIRTGRASTSALQRYEQLIEKVRSNPDHTPLSALRRLVWGSHPFEPIGYHAFYANISAGRYFLYIGLLQAMVKRFAPEYPLEELSRTYHGDQDTRTLAMLGELEQLSTLLADSLSAGDNVSEEISNVLEGKQAVLPANAPFTLAYNDFLHRYGHRGPREMELAAPSWRETPATILTLLKNKANQPIPANRIHGQHLAARNKLHDHLKSWQRRPVDAVRKRISKFIALRENTRHYHIMLFDVVRQKILELERELLHQQRLTMAGDIFFLRHAEIQALREGRLDTAQAHELVRKRRREWHRQARSPIQETFNIQMSPEDTADGALRGQCACPGQVEASARLIHSLSDAHQLAPGEILVAPYTDPAWTTLFSRAGGIVVGTGSFLSHAGTVARELHVPCIVDVKNCMQAISNGQRVRLDAGNGIVELLS